ncbi:MAG: hypothetical protein J5504_05965 [Butyrivibrio sp.]|nr:hypothetical protein [Butyrivibrio sp.]
MYDETYDKLNPTGVYCAYPVYADESIPVRQIKDTKCFITGPDASGEVVFYTIENANVKRLLGCKVPGEVHDCLDSNGNTISKEEFVSEFNEFMGIDWEKVASGIEKNIDLYGYLTGNLSPFIGYEHDRIDYAFDGEDIGKVRYNDSYAVYSDYISPKERLWVTLDKESERLYDAFVKGKEKAVFSADGNRVENADVFLGFEDGKAYTLEEISNKIRGVDDFTGCSPKYIDCGLDGNIELVVGIGGNLDYDPSYGIDMVVKNINGKLKICYCDASGYRSENDISYNGEVSNGGSGGATSHYGEVGYIDANGKYNFWYSWIEEEIAKIDTNNEQLDLYQEDLSVEDGAEDKDHYYSIFAFDNDGNVDEGNPSLKDDPCECERQTYRDKGYKVITLKEHDELIEKKRKKIGLSDEIHSYGDEYKDED